VYGIARIREGDYEDGRERQKVYQIALVWIVQKGAVFIIRNSSTSSLDEIYRVKGGSLAEDEIKWLKEPYQAKTIMGHG
jgi:diketogulonate reductase-like aldo/keto reductase